MALKYVLSLPDVLPNGPCKIYIDDIDNKWYGEDDLGNISLLSTENFKYKNLGEFAFFLEASQLASGGYIDPATLDDSQIHVYDLTNQTFLFSWTPPEITNFKNANEMLVLNNKSGVVDIFIGHRFDVSGINYDYWVLKLTNVRVDTENEVLIYDSYENIELTGYRQCHGFDFDGDHIYLTPRATKEVIKINRYGPMVPEVFTYTESDYFGSDNAYTYKGEIILPVYGDAPNYKQKVIGVKKIGQHSERVLINQVNEPGAGSVNWPAPIMIDENGYLYYFIGGDTRSTQVVKFDLATEAEIARITIQHPIKNIGSGAGVTRFKAWVHGTTMYNGKLYATTTRNPILMIIDLDTFTEDSTHILTDAQDTETTIFYGSYGGEETGYISDDIWVQGGQLFIPSEMMRTRCLVYDITSGTPVLADALETSYDNWNISFINDGNKLHGLEASASTDRGNGQFSGKTAEYRISDTQSSSFIAEAGYLYPLDLSGGAFTVTPPSSPTVGDFFVISDALGDAGVNNATIDFTTTGDNFHGSAVDDLLQSAEGTKKYIYINSTIGWMMAQQYTQVARLVPYFITASAGGSSTYSETNNIVDIDWTGGVGTYVLTLPSATAMPYRIIRFVNNSTITAADKVHITAPVGETIDGVSFYEINKPYNGCAVWSDGSNWVVIQAKAT